MVLHNSLYTGSVANPVLYAQDARLAQAGLLALNGPGPLDIRVGILFAPGSPLNVVGTSSTSPWQYSIAAGTFVASKGNLDGPHVGTNDGTTLITTTNPPGSNSRYDLIYAQQQDADATISADASTLPVLGVVQGVVSATPAVPALPAGAIALATALVASSATGGTSGAGVTIDTSVSRYTTVRGAHIPCRSLAEQNELTVRDGLQVYRLDTHAVQTYNGTTWVGQTGSTMGTPTATASNGTVTSGTTETRDAVLGSYVFTAVAGRRYRAVVDGLHVITSVAADQVGVNIRNGGALTPTAASTLVAAQQQPLPLTSTFYSLVLGNTFVPGAGPVTLGLFTVRVSGTGVETPSSGAFGGFRQLYAVDVGPA